VCPQPEALRPFLVRWVFCILVGGLAVSLVDGALLQRSESYFTGGFLSTEHLSGAGDLASFLSVSLLIDASVVGLTAGLMMWITSGLRPRAWVLAALLAGVGPLLVADVVQYQLVRFLGDAVDLRLMFDLTGDSIGEVLAVSASHLLVPTIVAGVGLLACASLVWAVNRGERGAPTLRPPVRVLLIPVLVLCAAIGLATTVSASNERVRNGVLRKPAGKAIAFVADQVTDIDRDGFGSAGRFDDPDPRNALVFPYAVETPGNRVDEDGVGGDLPSELPAYVEHATTGQWRRSPDVVVILLESFRFDLLGSRHDGKQVTPVMDALASHGVSSQGAYSHNGYTAQSRFHLLGGSLAGVRDGKSLIDDFAANGYTTVWVSGQDDSFGGPRYDAGFQRASIAIDARADRSRRYSTFTTAGSLAVPSDVVEEHIADVLQRRVSADRPLFLYVNFHDTHFPYSRDGLASLVSDLRLPRRRIEPGERDALWATYANTAANVDRSIGEVLDQVRRTRGREPAVIVTSDHGESLFDDGYLGHGYSLNDVQTRVPLVVANLPMVIEEPFGQIDLRDAVNDAMRTPAEAPDLPQVRSSHTKSVFQYLGQVNRPRQIARRTADGQMIWDFRTQRVQVSGGSWMKPEELRPHDRDEFQQLVWLWERMMIARASQVSRD
jgi:arylsulfatase A-like enzyme